MIKLFNSKYFLSWNCQNIFERISFKSSNWYSFNFTSNFHFWRSEVRRLVNGVCRRDRRIPHFCDEIRSSEKQEVLLSCVLAAFWVRHVWRTMKLHMSATNNNNILGKFVFSITFVSKVFDSAKKNSKIGSWPLKANSFLEIFII